MLKFLKKISLLLILIFIVTFTANSMNIEHFKAFRKACPIDDVATVKKLHDEGNLKETYGGFLLTVLAANHDAKKF